MDGSLSTDHRSCRKRPKLLYFMVYLLKHVAIIQRDVLWRFRSVAKGVMMDVKGDGVCETPLAFMRFLRASKNVVKSVMNIFVLTDQLGTIDYLIGAVSSEPCGLVRLQRECTDCWRGNVHKWNVRGLGNYLNEELETNSKALLVLETLELLKGLWVPMSILNKPIDVYTISPPAVCHTLSLIHTIVRFDVLNT